MKRGILITTLCCSIVSAPLTGCETMKENPKTTGTAAGGLTGAAAGALIGGEKNRLAGALIGGALGAGAGYLIGSEVKKNNSQHKDEAQKASDRAQQTPARPDDVRNSSTADLNRDGFVTLDEVIAMRKANLSDQQMIDRLRATGQVFSLNEQQQQTLRDNGVSQNVIDAMLGMNQTSTGTHERISY